MKTPTEALDQSAYQRIIRKTKELRHLNHLLSEALPPELQPHCQVMNIQNNQLTVQVDNSAWATQLQYRIPEILQTLRTYTALQTLHQIKLRVHPAYPTQPPPPQSPPPTLNAPQKAHLRSTAAYIKHSGLKAALLRLVGQC